ncbi:MAG TPA: DUF305 domain-containing protein [Actinomycetota bacterium]|nr:DUF305 domain-containing protein [Actinomycetota bacterium]
MKAGHGLAVRRHAAADTHREEADGDKQNGNGESARAHVPPEPRGSDASSIGNRNWVIEDRTSPVDTLMGRSRGPPEGGIVHGRLGWVIVVALLVAGCRGPAVVTGSPAASASDHTDVWFMQHMIPHLWQTSSIAFLTRDRIVHPELGRLADVITRRDQGDIEQLQGWLSLQGLAPHGHSHQRVDTRRKTDLQRLSRLRGTALDLAFLDVMLARERAGATMSAAEARSGTRPEVRQLARRMLVEQRADIRQMDAWKDAWAQSRADRFAQPVVGGPPPCPCPWPPEVLVLQ